MSGPERPTRLVSDEGLDDSVLPFAVGRLDLRGRVVRLGPSLDRILRRHAYPAPVSRLVGEALALTVLLGSSLKIAGRFQLQTRTDGAVDMIVVDFDAPDRLRAFARYDAERVRVISAVGGGGAQLLGSGHLAFTIDQGPELARYQGVVALAGQGLEEAAHQYFRQSEQIPTLARLAVAESATPQGLAWRAGGLLAQYLPAPGAGRRHADLHPGDPPPGAAAFTPPAEDDAWTEAKALISTVEDHELVDPALSSERLLFRLFHEPGVEVFAPQPVRDACRCSDESVRAMLSGFPPEDRAQMVGDDGMIGVTCEFCSTFRAYDPAEFNGGE